MNKKIRSLTVFKLTFFLNEKIIKAKKNLGIIKNVIPSVQTQFGVTLIDVKEKAERIQYQANLAVSGACQGCSHSKLYVELGRESLSGRR